VLAEFCLLSACLEGLEAMLDELFPAEVRELLEVLLKIGLRRLRASTDCHSEILVVVARRACLEEMSASLINRADEKTNTEWSLCGMECLDLRLLGNLADQALTGVMTVMSVPVVEAFTPHELA